MYRARCGERGGPRTPSTTTDANLDSAFVKNALLFIVLKFVRVLAPLNNHLLGLMLIFVIFGQGLADKVVFAVNAGGEAHTDVYGIRYNKDPLRWGGHLHISN